MRFDIITIFPHIFDSYLKESLFKRAQEKEIVEVKVHNLRDYAAGRHRKVDDRPYGGGPGMVLQIEPIYKAVRAISKYQFPISKTKRRKDTRIILFSTRGKKFNAGVAKRLSKYKRLIFICGRYEGVDERVAEYIADEEISIGDYVLSGGELPALTTIEAVSRFIPGFLGKMESLEEKNGSFPTYSRPEVFSHKKGTKRISWKVPKELLKGDHKKIAEWRKKFDWT